MRNRFSINSVLYAIIFILILIILSGTIFVYINKNAQPGLNLRHMDPEPQTITDSLTTFTELGQIRTVSAADENQNHATIILEPWFSYEKKDSAFTEELIGKKKKLRSIISDYFLLHTYPQLISLGESRIKSELLHLINKELTMGEISAIYFEEYLFLQY